MGYLNREHVASLLGVSRRRSFDIIPSDTTLGLVSTRAFARLLNACRVGDIPVVRDVPDVLDITAASRIAGVDKRRVRNWTVRIADRCPCWRISGKTILFEHGSLCRWLESHGIVPTDSVSDGSAVPEPPRKLKQGIRHG